MAEDLRTRIDAVLALKDLDHKYLEDIWHVSPNTIKNYFRKETPDKKPTKISVEKVSIFAKATNTDIGWLMNGDGIAPSGLNIKEPKAKYEKAKAGLNTAANYKSQIRALFAAVADDLAPGVYDIWEVEGNSMLPTFKPGDKVLCRMISIEEIIDERVYVIIVNKPELNDYRKSGIWVKRLLHRKGNGYVNCKSDNIDTSEPYPTFRLRESEIKEVWYPVLRLTPDMSNPNKDIYDKLADLESRLEMIEMMNE